VYCQKCGAQLTATMKFCPSCGAACPPAVQPAVQPATSPAVQPAASPAAAYPSPAGYAVPAAAPAQPPAQPKKRSLAPLYVILILLCLLLAAGCVLLIPNAVRAAKKGMDFSVPWANESALPSLSELEGESDDGSPDYLRLPGEDRPDSGQAPDTHVIYGWFTDDENGWENTEQPGEETDIPQADVPQADQAEE
jgi:hypothetical protein